MTVDPVIACLYLPEKRHGCLRMKYELQAGFSSEDFNALKKFYLKKQI